MPMDPPPSSTAERRPSPKGGCALVEMGCLKALRGGGKEDNIVHKEKDIDQNLVEVASVRVLDVLSKKSFQLIDIDPKESRREWAPLLNSNHAPDKLR